MRERLGPAGARTAQAIASALCGWKSAGAEERNEEEVSVQSY